MGQTPTFKIANLILYKKMPTRSGRHLLWSKGCTIRIIKRNHRSIHL